MKNCGIKHEEVDRVRPESLLKPQLDFSKTEKAQRKQFQ